MPVASLRAFALVCFATAAVAQPAPQPDPIEARVGALLARMTLEEKIGQLNLAPNNPNFDLGEITGGHVGGVLAFTAPGPIADAQVAARNSRLGIPLLVGLDIVHGLRTIFPMGLGLAASFDPAQARRATELAGRESAAMGVNWTFGPMVDLSRDPRWGRMIEGFGEDALVGSLFARASVEGFRAGGIATAIKHFAGYGAAQGGRDYDAADIGIGDFYDNYLPAFRAGIEAGSESVMSAFQTVNGVPVTASRPLLTGILRERWGFTGFVVSDWYGVGQLVDHGVAGSLAQAVPLAMNAGVDVDMAMLVYRRFLAGEIAAGRVTEAAVTEAARRVLRAKVRMGLLDRPPPTEILTDVPAPSPEMRRAAREIARETFVLLRNEGALPIGRSGAIRRVALIGGMADSQRDMAGSHAALVNHADSVTILAGMRPRAERAGIALAYAAGCTPACESDAGFAAAVETARGSDLVVAVLGETLEFVGEASSRAHLTLPNRQADLLAALVATGKPVVVVLVAGRPIELGPVTERLAGLIMTWYPGTEGGNAVADVLFGDADPAGKLPITWPMSVGQIPMIYNRLSTGRPIDNNEAFTTRYIDEKIVPLFPFGFGLSYTRFAIRELMVGTSRIKRDGVLEVRVRLTNEGERAGRETVQLYTRQLVASMSRPVRQLRAFQKVALAPGEGRTLTFRVPAAELGFHRNDATFVIEPGPFQVYVGDSSNAQLYGTFEVME